MAELPKLTEAQNRMLAAIGKSTVSFYDCLYSLGKIRTALAYETMIWLVDNVLEVVPGKGGFRKSYRLPERYYADAEKRHIFDQKYWRKRDRPRL